MTFGSVVASFNVEQFGTERLQTLTRPEIDERYEDFRRMTAIDQVPAALSRRETARSVARSARIPGTITPMSGFWAVFWLALVMKIPICPLLYIVWWAVKDPPEDRAADDGDGGSRRDGPHPRLRPPAASAPRPACRARAAGSRPRARRAARPAGAPEGTSAAR